MVMLVEIGLKKMLNIFYIDFCFVVFKIVLIPTVVKKPNSQEGKVYYSLKHCIIFLTYFYKF